MIRGSRCGFPYDHTSKVNCWWYLLFFFCAVERVYKAMSESSRVFRECPTWYSLSLFWLAFENSWFRQIPIKTRVSGARFEFPPEHLLFCRFLNGDAIHTVLVVVLFVFFPRGGVYGATSE